MHGKQQQDKGVWKSRKVWLKVLNRFLPVHIEDFFFFIFTGKIKTKSKQLNYRPQLTETWPVYNGQQLCIRLYATAFESQTLSNQNSILETWSVFLIRRNIDRTLWDQNVREFLYHFRAISVEDL